MLIIGDGYAQDLHKTLYIFREKDYKNLDVVTVDVSRRCKNVLSNTIGLNDHLFLTDRHCLGSDRVKRIDAPQYANLIKEADLIIVRSFWGDLPTIQMPALYD